MPRRLVSVISLLALVIGVVTATATSAQAAAAPTPGTPKLTVSLNRTSYVAAQKATITVHLTGPTGTQYVDIFETDHGKASVYLGTLTMTNGVASHSLTVGYTATYTASYDGADDGTNLTWYPALATTATIPVQAKLGSALSGSYKTKGAYHLVHSGKKADFDVAILPDKRGEKIYFPLQVLRGGKWHTVLDHAYTLKNYKDKSGTYCETGTKFYTPKNQRARIRGEYRGDSTNTANHTAWYYVQFTS